MASGKHTSAKKVQSSIEYISIFAIALLVLVVVIAVVAFTYFNNGSTHATSSCTISAQVYCVQIAMANNGLATKAVVMFTNQLGVPIRFNKDSISFFPGSSNQSFTGTCLPANALQGATIICNATLDGYAPSVGSQQEPRFILHYAECPGNVCYGYNTTGTGTVYISSQADLLTVQLVVSPSASQGTIYLDGVPYTSNSYVYLLNGTAYSIRISPSSGSTFDGWTGQGGISLQATASEGTTITVTSNGIVTANFAVQQLSNSTTTVATCYNLTLSESPSGVANTPTATSSANGCPADKYVAGENVTLTAGSPAYGYNFTSWSGTGSSNSTQFVLKMPANAAYETAGYGINSSQIPSFYFDIPSSNSVGLASYLPGYNCITAGCYGWDAIPGAVSSATDSGPTGLSYVPVPTGASLSGLAVANKNTNTVVLNYNSGTLTFSNVGVYPSGLASFNNPWIISNNTCYFGTLVQSSNLGYTANATIYMIQGKYYYDASLDKCYGSGNPVPNTVKAITLSSKPAGNTVSPISVATSLDGMYGFVAAQWGSIGGAVYVINTSNAMVENTLVMPAGQLPISWMPLSSNGSDLYLLTYSYNLSSDLLTSAHVVQISIPETATRYGATPTNATLACGGNCIGMSVSQPYISGYYAVNTGASSITVSPNGSTVYVASAYNPFTNPSGNTMIQELHVGPSCCSVSNISNVSADAVITSLVAPYGSRYVYAAGGVAYTKNGNYTTYNYVTVINASSGSVTGLIPLNATPDFMSYGNAGTWTGTEWICKQPWLLVSSSDGVYIINTGLNHIATVAQAQGPGVGAIGETLMYSSIPALEC